MSKIHPNNKIRDRNLSPSKVVTLLCKLSMILRFVENLKKKTFFASQNLVGFMVYASVYIGWH